MIVLKHDTLTFKTYVNKSLNKGQAFCKGFNVCSESEPIGFHVCLRSAAQVSKPRSRDRKIKPYLHQAPQHYFQPSHVLLSLQYCEQ